MPESKPRPREIDPKYLPTRLPIGWTLITWLYLDRFQAPGWAQGAAWTFVALLWASCLWKMGETDWVHPRDV
jgi:hypothetical protein